MQWRPSCAVGAVVDAEKLGETRNKKEGRHSADPLLFLCWPTATTGAHVGLQPCDLFLRPDEVLPKLAGWS